MANIVPLRATPTLDTSSPVSFFTNTANIFLKTSGYPFTVGNIPIYPTNCYTPALHRLLQLAANLYDSTTNRTFDDGTSPNGPFYPSVFRPTFFVDANTNIFINGYVEETTNSDWAATPLSISAPSELAQITSSTTNIYGIPYVIGARKGFPNFNEFTLQNFFQITRALEIVKPNPAATPGTWQTNLLFNLSISNTLCIAAWNSYSNAYPRNVQFHVTGESATTLTDGEGNYWATNQILSIFNYILSNQWQGIGPLPLHFNTNSVVLPLLSGIVVLPQSYYQNGVFIPGSGSFPFSTSSNLLMPHFVVTGTNRLNFVMVDAATGRIIDYVTLDNLNATWDLVAESEDLALTAWDTNNISTNNPVPVGVYNQIVASMGVGNPPPANLYVANLATYGSLAAAETAFRLFMIENTGTVAMQAPLTAYCKGSSLLTWQINDPLIHYTASDLQHSSDLFNVSPIYTNTYRTINTNSYAPWGYYGSAYFIYYGLPPFDIAIKDPLITQSDAWNFSSGQPLSLQTIGSVHRGTPWQTVYLKSATIDSNAWQIWTGDTNVQDALLSQPTNDWALVAALAPYLNTESPPQLFSINQTDPNAWAPLFEGMTVLTNTSTGLEPLTIDDTTDTNAITQIVADINSTRSSLPCGYYTSVGQLLSVPQLSVNSPFVDLGADTNFLNDAAYESIPSQLLPLVRPDSIGSAVISNGLPQFQFSGVDGWNYSVQASADLRNWTTIATQQQTTNGVLSFSDPAETNSSQRFYRTILDPIIVKLN